MSNLSKREEKMIEILSDVAMYMFNSRCIHEVDEEVFQLIIKIVTSISELKFEHLGYNEDKKTIRIDFVCSDLPALNLKELSEVVLSAQFCPKVTLDFLAERIYLNYVVHE